MCVVDLVLNGKPEWFSYDIKQNVRQYARAIHTILPAQNDTVRRDTPDDSICLRVFSSHTKHSALRYVQTILLPLGREKEVCLN
jgi:hypothetical protein